MKKYSILMLSFAFLFASCSKDSEQGPPGQDGNANVLSITKVVDANDWEEFEFENTTLFEAVVPLPELTAEIVDKGAVLAYIKDGSFLTPLPFTIYLNDNIDATYSYFYQPQQVFLELQFNTLVTGGAPPTLEYKFVIIDGFPKSESKSLPVEDYDQLMEYLKNWNE
jgi:hypothetical protein